VDAKARDDWRLDICLRFGCRTIPNEGAIDNGPDPTIATERRGGMSMTKKEEKEEEEDRRHTAAGLQARGRRRMTTSGHSR
jgi:hypothetical protein